MIRAGLWALKIYPVYRPNHILFYPCYLQFTTHSLVKDTHSANSPGLCLSPLSLSCHRCSENHGRLIPFGKHWILEAQKLNYLIINYSYFLNNICLLSLAVNLNLSCGYLNFKHLLYCYAERIFCAADRFVQCLVAEGSFSAAEKALNHSRLFGRKKGC